MGGWGSGGGGGLVAGGGGGWWRVGGGGGGQDGHLDFHTAPELGGSGGTRAC